MAGSTSPRSSGCGSAGLVSSVIAENEHYAEEPADVKPAEPHPLETGPVDPATGEPPSMA